MAAVRNFETILSGLNQAGVRYIVVGGLATVLHGHPRFTADIDLVVDLAKDQALKTVRALGEMGLVPRAPVPAEQFAEPEIRRRWIQEKGMQVFSMWDPADPMRVVDLFVRNPLDFEDLWAQSELVQLGSTQTRIASIPHLIQLKSAAGRAQDLEDIERLREIEQLRREEQ